ncbi:MAG: carboxymuconolactone decarboxylase family protein [Ginsengibacter sp.]|jgi:AhpD family alkylhydroperoxidase
MQKRINIKDLEPKAFSAMLGMEAYIRSTSLPPLLLELIKVRASVLNGCAYCIDMHSQEALKEGETTRRLFAVAAWTESPLFTEAERAALQLTDEVTLVSDGGVSDETYDAVIKHFGENGTAQIIMQIIIINSWNRIAISTNQIFEG